MSQRFTFVVTCLGLIGALAAGCGKDPMATKAAHLEKAERYVAEGKYPDAVIEYQNALRIDPADARAHARLGEAYLGQHPGSYAQPAFAAFSKAVELDPSLTDAQLRLGELLVLGRQFDAAAAKARLVLGRDPEHLRALMLLAHSALQSNRPQDAREAVAKAKAAHASDPKPWMAEATIAIMAKEYGAAEHALREAARLAPTSTEPLLTLGNLYRVQGKKAEAEAQYRSAIIRKPDDARLQVMLAQFYAATGDPEKAEAAYQNAIKTFPSEPGPRSAYAQHLIALRNLKGAAEQYEAVLKDHPGDLAAKKLLADVLLDQERPDNARPLVEALKAERKDDPDVLYLTARLLIVDRNLDLAVTTLQDALKADPTHPKAHRTLGLLLAVRGDLQQAKNELTEALKGQAAAWETRLALAELHLRTQAPERALELARMVLTALPRHPAALQVAGDALLAGGKPKEALPQYDAQIAAAPQSSAGYYRKGLAYRALNKPADAERQFRNALDRAPGSHDAVEQLVALLFQRHDRPAAVRLVESQIEKADKKAPLHALLGSVYASMGEPAKAEAAYQQAIDLDKNLVAAYAGLGRLYARQRDPEKVIGRYRAMVAAAPTLPAPHVLLGLAYQSQKRDDDAIAEYEQALKLDSRFAPAANNLAWLYAERDKNIDTALRLALTAREQWPDDPSVADTLAWIYYKQGAYLKAVTLLRESSQKLPDNAVVRYHLGMASYKNGDRVEAKRALERALKLDPSFPGSDEAKQVLAEVTAL